MELSEPTRFCNCFELVNRLVIEIILMAAFSFSTVLSDSRPSRIHCQVLEEQPKGTIVADLKTFNNNLEATNSSFVVLMPGSAAPTNRMLFEIDAVTGILSTAEVIDRDVICPRRVTCIVDIRIGIVHHSSSSRYFRLLLVAVDILDINDNRPEFSQSQIDTELSESTSPGILFPLPQAIDIDSPMNAVVRYRLQSSTRTFGLSITPGSVPKLVLREPLDRERQDKYRLEIVADDDREDSISDSTDVIQQRENSGHVKKPPTTSLFVNVAVLDENDNGPNFQSEKYSTSLDETQQSVGYQVLQLNATDPDLLANSRVRYSFCDVMPAHNLSVFPFSIDHVTGSITISGKLDYERHRSTSLCVEARDVSAPEGIVPTATATVLVNLTRRVEFLQPEIQFKPGPTWKLFASNKTWYQLMPRNMQKMSQNGTYAKTINCHKNYNSSLVGRVSANLSTAGEISSTNSVPQISCYLRQEKPELPSSDPKMNNFGFEQNSNGNYNVIYIFSPPVASNVSYFTLLVTCVDFDTPTSVTSSIALDIFMKGEDTETDWDNDCRPIEDLSNTIGTNNSIKKAKEVNLSTTISPVTSGCNSLPFDKHSYVFDVAENMPPPVRIGHVISANADSGCFKFRMGDKPDVPPQFRLDDEDGILISQISFDRETADSYSLTIYAKPTKMNAIPAQVRDYSAQVIIRVIDVNDNAPKFAGPRNEQVRVDRSFPVGHFVANVMATDADTDMNGRLFYELRHVFEEDGNRIGEINYDNIFRVDDQTGNVFIADSLEDLPAGTQLHLTISASDSGTPSLSSEATLTVIVEDASAGNDKTVASVPQAWLTDDFLVSPAAPESTQAFPLQFIVLIGVASGVVACVGIAIPVTAVTLLLRRAKRRRRLQDSGSNVNVSPSSSLSDRALMPNADDVIRQLQVDATSCRYDKLTSASKQLQLNGWKVDWKRPKSLPPRVRFTPEMYQQATPGLVNSRPATKSTDDLLTTSTQLFLPVPPISTTGRNFANWLRTECHQLGLNGNSYRIRGHRAGQGLPPPQTTAVIRSQSFNQSERVVDSNSFEPATDV